MSQEVTTAPLWVLKEIESTLRMTANIHHSTQRETCFDRQVMRSWNFINDIIKGREASLSERYDYYNKKGQKPY